jgi:hypothetical protein
VKHHADLNRVNQRIMGCSSAKLNCCYRERVKQRNKVEKADGRQAERMSKAVRKGEELACARTRWPVACTPGLPRDCAALNAMCGATDRTQAMLPSCSP